MTFRSPTLSKPQLRQLARDRRSALGDMQRTEFSARIMERLQQKLATLSAKDQLLTYRAMSSEVDTGALYRNPPCRLFAPLTHSHEHMEFVAVDQITKWQTGIFGIQEPTAGKLWQPDESSTILLIPLTAFDRQGNRLGMGKGCFDIWLAQHRPSISRIIGLAFSCQEMEAIPAEPHDIPLDAVITEKESITCRTS